MSRTRDRILETIGREWMSFIIRGKSAEQTLSVCEALIAGGASLVEVAFTTPRVCEAIEALRKRHDESIVLAAGTVRSVGQASDAMTAGVDVIVSPETFMPVIDFAVGKGLVSVPGCFTPTEIGTALRAGAHLIKLFPCSSVGPEYIGYIHGPFPEARILPAGAVTLENMRAWHAAGAFAAVAGVTTEMKLLDAVERGNWDRISAVTRTWLSQVKEMKHDN